jgi:protein AroM
MRSRVAFVTIGQTPRPDLCVEVAKLVGVPIEYDEFGALDGIPPADLLPARAVTSTPLVTRLSGGMSIEVDRDLVHANLQRVIGIIDRSGYDLIALVSTGIYTEFCTKTPLVHGQRVIDTWLATFTGSGTEIGVFFPLPCQAAGPYRSIQAVHIGNALPATLCQGPANMDLRDAPAGSASLILLHSVGFSEDLANSVAMTSGKPVVTARRVIAGAIGLRLQEIERRRAMLAQHADRDTGGHMPVPDVSLTRREEQVLALVFEGHSNKAIARHLSISHRTVEIHRSRAIAKFGATSTLELMRRALLDARL